jgi:hypothetical protein
MNLINKFSEFSSLNENLFTIYKDRETLPEVKDAEEAVKMVEDGVYEFKFMNYLISIDMEKMTMGILKLTPKGKYSQYKVEQNYRYGKPERLIESLKYFINNKLSFLKRKEEEKEQKQEFRKTMVNPFKVGDILYDSWGYEQTNIDFFQVTKVSDKSVWITPIAQEQVPNTQGHASANVRPIKDKFVGEEQHKPLVVSTWNKEPYISSKHGGINLYTQGEKGVYSSWGY